MQLGECYVKYIHDNSDLSLNWVLQEELDTAVAE